MKPTPGPWKPHVVSGDVRQYSTPGDLQNLNTNGSWATGPLARNRMQAAADARLIAAAPELLDAIRGLLTCSLPVDVSGQRCVDDARAAIAKATGGTS